MGVISTKEKCYLCGKEKVKIARLNYLGEGEESLCENCAFFYNVFEEMTTTNQEEDLIILKDLNEFFSYKRSNEVNRFAELILECTKNKEEFRILKAKNNWQKRWKYTEEKFIEMTEIAQIMGILGNRETIIVNDERIDIFNYGKVFIRIYEQHIMDTRAKNLDSIFADRGNIISFIETLIGIGYALRNRRIDNTVIQIWKRISRLIMDSEGEFLRGSEYYEQIDDSHMFRCQCGDKFKEQQDLLDHYIHEHPEVSFPLVLGEHYTENTYLKGYKYSFKALSEKQDSQTSDPNYGRLLNELIKHKNFIIQEFYDPADNVTYQILNPKIGKIFQKALIKTKEQLKEKDLEKS